MFITDFKIKDCLYISNTEIRSIHATLEESMQLILGSNGSGKSVVCRLLTGYPPKPKSFKSGGFFEMSGKRGIDTYTIRYDFTKSVKCTFIRNDVVLNDKSTTTVQKDLLKEHLGIDQDIFKLLSGSVKFTSMSANERKRWIDKVSPIDMTYITKVYDTVRKKARDIKGAIRVNTDRLNSEVTRLDALGLDENIESDYESVNERFLALSREYDAKMPKVSEVVDEIKRKNELIQSNLSFICKLKNEALTISKERGITTFGALDERLTYIRVEDNAHIAKADNIAKAITGIESIINTFEGSSSSSLDELKTERDSLQRVIDKIDAIYPDGLPFMLTWEDVHLFTQLPTLTETIRKLSSDIPNNVKPDWYTYKEATILKERYHDLKTDIRNLDMRIEEGNRRLKEMRSSKLINCENCNHTFHIGFTQEDVDRIEDGVNALGQRLVGREKELENITVKLEELHAYTEAANLYRAVKENTPMIMGFWATVEEKNYLGTTPGIINDEFSIVRRAAEVINVRAETMKKLNRVEAIIGNMSSSGSTDKASLEARRDSYVLKREKVLEKIEANSHVTATLNSFRRLAFEQESLMNNTTELVDSITKDYGQLALISHNDVLREEINELMSRLAMLQELVNKKKVLNGVIQGIKEQLDEIIQQEEDWKALTQLLSPEHGIIAKQVNSYIGGFITIMNQVINSVWTYPMKVEPCSVEAGGLNYLFPVSMPTKRSSPDDVSECSEGQMGIIDFAFSQAVIQCLELTHLSRFLDELGREFDEEHAVRLMVYLNRLLETGNTKQIFLVNHFQSMHGSLKNAEVLVLDSDNVSAPVSANSHVEFNKL